MLAHVCYLLTNKSINSFVCQFFTRVISQSVMKVQESVDTTDLKAGSLSRLNYVFFYLSVFDASD